MMVGARRLPRNEFKFSFRSLQYAPHSEILVCDVMQRQSYLDWLNDEEAKEVALALGQHVAKGGRVIWRSAAYQPKYARFIENSGFTVTRVHAHTEAHEMIDLVNTYASFWLAVKI